MNLTRYSEDKANEWNTLVATSKNATFLLDRRFMDYHSDRFSDCSLMFTDKNKVIAALPASYDATTRCVTSHGGLTYGGLIMSSSISQEKVLECFSMLTDYYRTQLGARTLRYKPIPYIYIKYPSEEDLYALFRHNATLTARGVSQCLPLRGTLKTTESRKGGIRKATAAGCTARETDDYTSFWNILNDVLTTLHSVAPVHSTDEMQLLASRFPDNISLYATYSKEGKMLAGAWVFRCGKVVHTQYLAASPEGKAAGALDLLIAYIIQTHSHMDYLDFGISTEQGGTILNGGLTFQKEGFGGRGVCYDQYEIRLE